MWLIIVIFPTCSFIHFGSFGKLLTIGNCNKSVPYIFYTYFVTIVLSDKLRVIEKITKFFVIVIKISGGIAPNTIALDC